MQVKKKAQLGRTDWAKGKNRMKKAFNKTSESQSSEPFPSVLIQWRNGLGRPATIFVLMGDPDVDAAVKNSLEPFLRLWKRPTPLRPGKVAANGLGEQCGAA